MNAPFGVDIGAGFFGVSGTRENDVGKLGADIPVVALVDNEGVRGDVGGGDFVGTEKPDDFRGDKGLSVGGGDEADVVGGGAGSGLKGGKGLIN